MMISTIELSMKLIYCLPSEKSPELCIYMILFAILLFNFQSYLNSVLERNTLPLLILRQWSFVLASISKKYSHPETLKKR